MTPQEKAWLDQLIILMKVLQVQVSNYAAAAKRARSKERREVLLTELHDYQRQFDQMNDVIAPRYRIELKDRSHHPDACRSGEFAKKMGIKLPGPPPPIKCPDVLLKLLEEGSTQVWGSRPTKRYRR